MCKLKIVSSVRLHGVEIRMKAAAIHVGMKEDGCDDHIGKNEIQELHRHH